MRKHALPPVKRNNGSLFIARAFLLSIIILCAFQTSPLYAYTPIIGKQENLDRAGVSVVRLLATYTASNKQTIQCTGLGVLIASTTTANTSEPNNLLLTDGSIINPGIPDPNPNQNEFAVWYAAD